MSEAHAPILVIEDDRDLRDSLCGVLEIEGFPTAAAGNGQEALSWLRTNPRPCVILLDLMMPVMNGHEFRSQQVVDADLSRIPVIVLSALDEARQRSDLSGAQAYLKKPIEPDALIDTIRRFC